MYKMVDVRANLVYLKSITFNTKCKEIFVSRADCAAGGSSAGTIEFRVIAELTNIPVGELTDLTGSGLTSSGSVDN